MAAQFGSDSFPLEFNFIDNPIIVHVDSSYFEFPSDSTFRQIVVHVNVYSTWDSKYSTYHFYVDVSAGTDLFVDISSALRASMKGWEPDVSYVMEGKSDRYPYAKFSVTLSEKYLLEGVVNEVTGATREEAFAFYGGLTGYERLTLGSHPADFFEGLVMTRKPASSPELYPQNTKYPVSEGIRTYTSGTDPETGAETLVPVVRVSAAYTTFSEEGNVTYKERPLYIIPEDDNYRIFAFVNSLGVIETVMAQSFESLSYSMESEIKNLASAPVYFAKPNRTTHKTGGYGKFEMSSGIVDRAWSDWWTTEFLMAKKYWMIYDDRWIPVTVVPIDDEVTIYNKAEQRMSHVDFDVEIAVEGSIMNQVRT